MPTSLTKKIDGENHEINMMVDSEDSVENNESTSKLKITRNSNSSNKDELLINLEPMASIVVLEKGN